MIVSRSLLMMFVASFASTVAAESRIDFTGLTGANVSDADGQTFSWSLGSNNGTVNVKSSYDTVQAIDGSLRTPVKPPASLASPFTGTLTFAFDRPVQINVLASFASLINDGLEGGRFEEVQLSAPNSVTFGPSNGTLAMYSGAGTNAIAVRDFFSPTPTPSPWGFLGTGLSPSYQFQYTGTHQGLSETFDVAVTAIPEPATVLLIVVGAGTLPLLARKRGEGRRHCDPRPARATA